MAGWLKARADEVQLALTLLTCLPVHRLRSLPETVEIAATVWSWPLAGLVASLPAALVIWLTSALGLPPLAAALLALGTGLAVTGALHEDGLADTADGFGGGRTKERKLEIMRDSRVGTYGVLASILSLGLRAVSLGAIVLEGGAGIGALCLIAAAMTSRAAMGLPLLLLRPARPDGLAASLGDVKLEPAVAGFLIAALLTLLLLTPPAASALVLMMVLAPLPLAALAHKQIGGHTGDVLGATQQVAEITGLLVLSAVIA
jgi:adenosylcobinamide-GDP ribazoletransferase